MTPPFVESLPIIKLLFIRNSDIFALNIPLLRQYFNCNKSGLLQSQKNVYVCHNVTLYATVTIQIGLFLIFGSLALDIFWQHNSDVCCLVDNKNIYLLIFAQKLKKHHQPNFGPFPSGWWIKYYPISESFAVSNSHFRSLSPWL